MNETLILIKVLSLILGLPLVWALIVKIYYTALEQEQKKVYIKVGNY